ncbi:MAG: hypothetical protein HC876_14805 [Chloroflexaceae bacterium]|nr:hypothetical protein [Chloroflexaceae bacterium]
MRPLGPPGHCTRCRADPATRAPGAMPADVPDTGWVSVAQGVERRRMLVTPPHAPDRLAPIHIARFDPAHTAFQVGYAPADPHLLSEWCNTGNPLAVINGGFLMKATAARRWLFRTGYPAAAVTRARGGCLLSM